MLLGLVLQLSLRSIDIFPLFEREPSGTGDMVKLRPVIAQPYRA